MRTSSWKRRGRLVPLFLLLFLAGPLGGGSLSATTLRPLNIEEMTLRAGDIVVGRCLGVKSLGHGRNGLPVTEVTVRVDRTLKGRGRRTLTFKMVGTSDQSPSEPGITGLPRFHAGEDILLFLYPVGPSGLTSPVGLGQGKFIRRAGKDGREEAVNEFDNRHLFRNLSPGAARKAGHPHPDRPDHGGLLSSDLITTIEELAR